MAGGRQGAGGEGGVGTDLAAPGAVSRDAGYEFLDLTAVLLFILRLACEQPCDRDPDPPEAHPAVAVEFLGGHGKQELQQRAVCPPRFGAQRRVVIPPVPGHEFRVETGPVAVAASIETPVPANTMAPFLMSRPAARAIISLSL